MEKIKRYILTHNDPKQSNDRYNQMIEFPTGFYVKYADHEQALTQARKDALEEAAKIAENNFMNGVLPGTVSVRDFIAQAIRKAKEKAQFERTEK